MIIVEQIPDHPGLVRRYSDEGKLLLQEQTGAVYAEAVDVETSPYTYTETDAPAEDIDDAEALNILLGRDGNEP